MKKILIFDKWTSTAWVWLAITHEPILLTSLSFRVRVVGFPILMLDKFEIGTSCFNSLSNGLWLIWLLLSLIWMMALSQNDLEFSLSFVCIMQHKTLLPKNAPSLMFFSKTEFSRWTHAKSVCCCPEMSAVRKLDFIFIFDVHSFIVGGPT